MPELVNSLLLFLATEVVYSTILFALILVVTAAIGNRAPALRFWLWSLVLVRLVLPTDLASPLSARSLLVTDTTLSGLTAEVMEQTTGDAPVQQSEPVEIRTPWWRSALIVAWGLGVLAALLLSPGVSASTT